MALAGLPPWLNISPDTFLSAIRSGAGVGAQIREQDIQQAEAGDRLRLAYAQLASQEQRSAEQTQAKLELAHATLSARERQMDLMAQFRQQALDQAQQRASDLNDYRSNMLGQRQAELASREQSGAALQDLREKRMADLEQFRQAREADMNFRQGMLEKNLALREAIAKRPHLSDTDKALMQADVSELRDVDRQLTKLGPANNTGVFGHLFHPLGGNSDKISELSDRAKQLRDSIADYGKDDSSEGSDMPFEEGQLIRHKGSGKVYRVVDGEPELVPDNQSE